MAKLTKAQAKAHAAACDILRQDRLGDDDREFVIQNWREDATHVNSSAGAFFTPLDMALTFTVEVSGRGVIDLCAGIGCLSLASWWRRGLEPREIVCIEKNPDYVAVGKKLLPEARWICADVFDLPTLDLGHFDCAISNPPFGAVDRQGRSAPRYSGRSFEYHVIDLAADVAEYGVFIIPQMSAPFRYSGERFYVERKEDGYLAFERATGISLLPNCGIDTTEWIGDWRGVAPKTEIVIAEFAKPQAVEPAIPTDQSAPQGEQLSLFERAAA